MFFSTTLAATTLLLLATQPTTAHMLLKSPIPYADSTDKSPLKPDGSNFPCKNVPYTISTMNNWPTGSNQSLQWLGTATHGGGSCQVSVTQDKPPTKSSVWKVIYSIEGGCPDNAPGNYEDGDKPERKVFDFEVPRELPDGEYVAAATWFNHVGAREMYMVCAPVKVSGGAGGMDGYLGLPDMAVANVAGQGECRTQEGLDYEFENPGKYVVKAGKGPYGPLCVGSGLNAGQGTPPAVQQPAAGGGAAASASASLAMVTSTVRQVVTVTAPSGAAPTSLSPVASAPAAQAPGSSDGSSCSPDGAIVCNGPGQFAICNFGKAVFQPVAAGTTCEAGKIAKRQDIATTLVKKWRAD